MKLREFIIGALLSGLLIVAPIYVAVLLLLKAVNSFMRLVRPAAGLFPEWVPAGELLSLLLVLLILLLVGILARTRIGQLARHGLEQHLLEKLPGYSTVRSFTARLAGESLDEGWKPALAEIEECLSPRSSLRSLEMAGSPSSFLLYLRLSLGLSIFSAPIACIR